ncbi:hypothetical protein CEXT_23381 [Caerostris extrusa]|uniref:EGF-like domain-containing protein n=1 Tax=Caerostris extrusa TaxID=172846 RepID=A0AAV4S2F0_CAEEX|nr:hypothetical protein CEXT_23381 [Caerostris extrusa]
MECINLPGSFGCQCKEGYEPKSTSNSKIYGCKDINECKFNGACFSPDTKCVNTEGSFDCVCKEGYYPTAPTGGKYYPSYVTCHAEETQWREATIALGVIMGIAIVSLSLYIACQRSC